MLAKLRQAVEIAVDLEHRSYRAYAGFYQGRKSDWIVDAVEVFHGPGADSDIIWLQQDFNLYVVNLFDMFHASRLIFPDTGLPSFLKCTVITNGINWLISGYDTHFLLYIYDCLRNALIDRSQSRPGSHPSSPSTTPSPHADGQNSHLRTVIARSRETSLRTYQKELYDGLYGSGPNGWDTLARKWNKSLMFANNNDDVGKVVRMYAWRDKVAREEDESIRSVLLESSL
ncbi:hypothetical protein M378DRAFT_179911 [Amanita muscaria Koide BX008]|uniref:HRDC domain-containing protein n=1 Tax=Amanita muscaria (strain Koide BX008) TaxID=946122 RepID=A0A0C2WJZ7_AMAMK|nr:hypothetical protein M378DRAFT_179911 [Amanita muscaria Koide BX008]